LVIDLSDTVAEESALANLRAVCADVDRVLLFAGVDSRLAANGNSLRSFEKVLLTNCVAQVRTLCAILQSTNMQRVHVVAASSDVVGAPQKETFAYAASKACLEEALRHLPKDFSQLAVYVLILRLPFLGTSMSDAVPPQNCSCPKGTPRLEVLDQSCAAIMAFLRSTTPPEYTLLAYDRI
jgi:short-subunit dehydrogenase